MVAKIITQAPETVASSKTTTATNSLPSLMSRPALLIRRRFSNGSNNKKRNRADIAFADGQVAEDGKSKTRQRRSVHFDVDENDVVQPTFHYYEGVREEEKELVYSSQEEMQGMRVHAKQFASDYASAHSEVRLSIERLMLDSPMNRYCSEQSRAMLESDAIRTLASSGSRGLEMRIGRVLYRHQKWARDAVVSKHQQLKKDGALKATTYDAVLRSRCLQVNKCTSDYAFLIAHGDAMTARTIYEEGMLMM